MGWVKELLNGLYEIYKKRTNSTAQKRAKREAEAEAYARLLSQGVLMEFIDQLQVLEIKYLEHLNDFHKGGGMSNPPRDTPMISEDYDDLPPPPPPLDVEEEAPAQPQAPSMEAKKWDVIRRYQQARRM